MYQPRMTLQTRMVLISFLKDPDSELYGREICDLTGLAPGTIYPILHRTESAGWVEARWEERGDITRRGRPPRRYYRLTAEGWTAARKVARQGTAT